MLEAYDEECTARTQQALEALDEVLYDDSQKLTSLHTYLRENMSEWQDPTAQFRVRGFSVSIEDYPQPALPSSEDPPPQQSRKPSRRVSFSDQPLMFGEGSPPPANKSISPTGKLARMNVPRPNRVTATGYTGDSTFQPHYEPEPSLPLPALLPRVMQVKLPHRPTVRMGAPSTYPQSASPTISSPPVVQQRLSALSPIVSPVQYHPLPSAQQHPSPQSQLQQQQLQEQQQQRSPMPAPRPISSLPASITQSPSQSSTHSPSNELGFDASRPVPTRGFRVHKQLHATRNVQRIHDPMPDFAIPSEEPQQRYFPPPVRTKYVSARELKDVAVRQTGGVNEMQQLGIAIGTMGLALRAQPFAHKLQRAPVRSSSRKQ